MKYKCPDERGHNVFKDCLNNFNVDISVGNVMSQVSIKLSKAEVNGGHWT